MAIKVNGTTVIDNSRNFTNIAGGFKTVNGVSVVGSGNISAGSSTSYNAVGTYVFGHLYNTGGANANSTYAGSGINPAGLDHSNTAYANSVDSGYVTRGSGTLSGTWRAMGTSYYPSGSNRSRYTLFVRIS